MTLDKQAEHGSLQTNIARLMVRRHLRPVLDSGADEQDLILRFKSISAQNPDMKFQDVARKVWLQYLDDFGSMRPLIVDITGEPQDV